MTDDQEVKPRRRGAAINSRFVHKMRDPIVNPCIPETDASQKCLTDNNFNRDKCNNYFTNYNNCMKFWTKVSLERKWKGVKPHLPPPEEREQILLDRNVPVIS